MLRVAVHRTSGFVLLCAGLLSLAATDSSLCPTPVVSPDSLVVPIHSNVTLNCSGCNNLTSWKRHSQTSSPVKTVPRLLKNVQYKHVDNYTCFSDKKAVCTVQLLMEEKLETPVFRCYLRYPAHKIVCEWTPEQELPRSAKTTLIKLILHNGSKFDIEKGRCTYNHSTKKVRCSVKSEEMLHTPLFLSMCVMGSYNSRKSKMLNSTVGNLVYPDPPVNVMVSPVKGAPRMLKVSWGVPKFWNLNYYGLHYQVQYRVENYPHTSDVLVREPSYVITDAVMGRKHNVRVRAQEEFKHGSWSDWSLPTEGTPWRDHLQTSPTQDPGEYDVTFYSSKESDSEEGAEAPTHPPKSVVHQYTLLVIGVNLGLFCILFVGIMMRAQMVRRQVKLKGTKLWDLFFRLSDGARGNALTSNSLLLTPCASPTPEKNIALADDNGR